MKKKINEYDSNYSIFLENKNQMKNKKSDPLNTVLPKKIRSWVEDESVINCYKCKKDFSFFRRKHHCRLCGRIFCHKCCKDRIFIPQDLLSRESKKVTWQDYINSYVVNIDLNKYKVCITCHELIQKVNQIKKIIDIFINHWKLDVKLLKKLGQVCRLWNHASNYCLSIFKEIQYKLPTDSYSKLEIDILWRNRDYFSGHNKHILNLLKICKTDLEIEEVINIIERPKKISCWSLMCTSSCKNKLTSFDAINLLAFAFRKKTNTELLKKIALRHLKCSDIEFKCYLPFLVYNIRYDNGLISEFLIRRCFKNFKLLNALYWEFELYPTNNYHEEIYSETMNKITKLLSQERNEKQLIHILQEKALIKKLENISSDIIKNKKKYKDIKDKYSLKVCPPLPFNPNIKVKKICIENIKVKHSISRPIIFPCETKDGKIVEILFKNECLRKDQMIANLITLIDIILKKEENLDLGLVHYEVLPINKTSGLIEIVKDADTVYHIKEKLKSNILNYIMENNGDKTINELRKIFIKSTAIYSVITYILGVGDRHLDNIMITKDGRLFHIDYGYILGKDPVFSNPSIRITPDVIEAIGGFSSKYYIDFKELSSQVYNCLRQYIDIFMNMLLILPKISDIKLSEKEIKEQIIKRFVPGESRAEAKFHLVKKLENTTIAYKIKDFCHYHSKERTLSSSMTRLISAMSNLWTSSNNK